METLLKKQEQFRNDKRMYYFKQRIAMPSGIKADLDKSVRIAQESYTKAQQAVNDYNENLDVLDEKYLETPIDTDALKVEFGQVPEGSLFQWFSKKQDGVSRRKQCLDFAGEHETKWPQTSKLLLLAGLVIESNAGPERLFSRVRGRACDTVAALVRIQELHADSHSFENTLTHKYIRSMKYTFSKCVQALRSQNWNFRSSQLF